MEPFFRFENLGQQAECLHGVTMKNASHPLGFSMALHTCEPKAMVVANRKMIEAFFEKERIYHFILANQTHSDHVHVVKEPGNKGWEGLESAVPDCDALVTNLKGVMLGILTADCVPILLYDPVAKAVAAVHAGWKGTKANIVAKTIQTMQREFGTKPDNLIAGIAPSIGVCCYEVGKDVASYFFDLPDAIQAKKNSKYMLDLPEINKLQLITAGMREEKIEMSNICTSCDVEHFFSYRKESGCSGRFMSLIGLTETHLLGYHR